MISKLSLSVSFLRLNRNAISKIKISKFSTEDDGSHNDFKPKKKDIPSGITIYIIYLIILIICNIYASL